METGEKTKQKRPKRMFSDEFKAGAVALVLKEGRTIARVARDLDLTPSSLGKWVEQARADAGKSTRGTLTTEEKEELSRLRKENRELRLEREILKKLRRQSKLDVRMAGLWGGDQWLVGSRVGGSSTG